MSSLRRIYSSRANGARSRGPKTPQGKRRSSDNSIRHGLLARVTVLAGESRESFEALIQHHVDRFGPLDGVEFGMVEEMASAYWRLRRLMAIETRLMDDSVQDQQAPDQIGRFTAAFRALAAGPEFPLLQRYQVSLRRAYRGALHSLLLLRANYETNPVPETDSAG